MTGYYEYGATRSLARPLALVGFVNHVTRAAANALSSTTGLPLRLLDDLVEHRLGMSVTDVLVSLGLPAWRRAETEELQNVVRSQPHAVIALGEGALAEPANAELVTTECRLIHLSLDFEQAQQLSRRQALKLNETLLAEIAARAGDPEPGRRLFDERRAVFERAHDELDAARRSAQELGEQLTALLDEG